MPKLNKNIFKKISVYDNLGKCPKSKITKEYSKSSQNGLMMKLVAMS